jgi:hypothetical protein
MNKYRLLLGAGHPGRALVLVLLMAGALPAQAGAFWLHTCGFSSHASSNVRNESNAGSGLEYRFDEEWALGFGRYENSFFRESRYLLANWTPLDYRGLRMGLTMGMVTGYHKKKYGLHGQAVPVLLPTIDYRWERVSVSLMAAPPLGEVSAGSLMLQIKLSLKK